MDGLWRKEEDWSMKEMKLLKSGKDGGWQGKNLGESVELTRLVGLNAQSLPREPRDGFPEDESASAEYVSLRHRLTVPQF